MHRESWFLMTNLERNEQMKKYEIALSYAHKDQEIANRLGEQLELAFADGFFMDELRPEELASAELFREKLKDIFRRSDYAVILYSQHYREGQFTSVEKDQIFKKKHMESRSHCFIINVDDCEITEEPMEGLTYIPLKINGITPKHDGSETVEQAAYWEKIDETIHDIIQNRIKKRIILQSAEKKKEQSEYSLRVQTLCPYNNSFRWDRDYDWNILAKAFVDTADGRSLKQDDWWPYLWSYVDTDFKWIQHCLVDMQDVKWRIHLNCHLSIAYKHGQAYGDLRQASGNRNLVLISSNRNQNVEFAFNPIVPETEIEDFCREYVGNCPESTDIVCIVSIKPHEQGNVLETVRQFWNQNGKKCCKIYLFQKEILIEDADMLESMAAYLREKMIACRTGNGCNIHLFPDTTAPLMFALGARSVFPGTVQLYEYIPQKDTYVESLTN